MSLLNRLFIVFSGFKAQLLGIVTLGILSLALAASVTTAWVTSTKASQLMVAQGLQIADTLAAQSLLALLYASPQNAQDPLNTILSFPNIIHAAIYQTDFKLLASLGDTKQGIPSFDKVRTGSTATVIRETNQAWHIAVPVITGRQNSPLDDRKEFLSTTLEEELIGYAYIVLDKATLKALQYNIFLNNILIALTFALILIALTNLGIKRLTKPLYQLIKVMNQNQIEGAHIRAELQGPKEINKLANEFNSMMSKLEDRDKKLRRYGKKLEAEVQIQTRELTETRDAALSANRHKSEFLANISHELRTPLQGIIGYSDLVKEELDFMGADEQVAQIGHILSSSHRLLTLINDILHLSKIESGRMDINLETIDLNAIITEAVETVAPMMIYNNNQLTVESHNEKTTLSIDREKLLQVILNLLSNAAKFTKSGQIVLSSWLTETQLSIEVKDTGIGLKADQLEIVFEKFRQVDGSSTRSYEGTGLGLAISKGFCELMGGKISVNSSPDEGSTFGIVIPLPIIQDGSLDQTFTSGAEKRRFIATY
ncbi:MAG: HAMP domain-containing sensor histidine kinase [Desulfuromusa sp.]|nr:HAMP domain-containing sensor histidine kinase [Desulfuromusa sp.]